MVPANLHPSIEPARVAALSAILARAGIRVMAGAARVMIAPLAEFVADPSEVPELVLMFDGHLGELQADLLRRNASLFLLACRHDQGLPSDWEARALAVALGPDPLSTMMPQPVLSLELGSVADLGHAAQQASDVVKAAGGPSAAADRVADVMHEIAANALLDAPVDERGKPKYAHRRGAQIDIAPCDACKATIAIEGGRAYLSVSDHFGRLTVSPVASVVAGLAGRTRVNSSGGGAGLGLRRIVEQSELVAVRVRSATMSEVVCVLVLDGARRRTAGPKSVFFTRTG